MGVGGVAAAAGRVGGGEDSDTSRSDETTPGRVSDGTRKKSIHVEELHP